MMGFIAVDYWIIVLLFILLIAALSIYFIENLVRAVIVFGAYSLTMSLIWLLMSSPDLAITDAAAGISTTILMMVVIFRINRKVED